MNREELKNLQLRWNILVQSLDFPGTCLLNIRGEAGKRITTNWGSIFRAQWLAQERAEQAQAHTQRILQRAVEFAGAELDAAEPQHARNRLCHACREGTLVFGSGTEKYRDPHLTCGACGLHFRTDLTPLEMEYGWRDGIPMPKELVKALPKPRRRQPGRPGGKTEAEG